MIAADYKYRDADSTVYDARCPGCALALEWAVETPPIPLTLYSWFDPDGEGIRLVFCPNCDVELPAGDLRLQAA